MTDTTVTETYIENIMSKINEDIVPKTKSDLACAAGIKYEAGSCAKLVILVELTKAYNKSVSIDKQIKLDPKFELLNPQKYKLYLVYELNKHCKEDFGCTTQKCWEEQAFIKFMEKKAREEFLRYTFRPNSPQGQFDWLSTFDINDAMAQYERKYTGFKFFGAVPMDFADLDLEINTANYEDYCSKGITKLGIIFNLDNHDQPGSHWVAMYTDLNKGDIFYFDSFAQKPEPRVRTLMRKQARFIQSQKGGLNKVRVDYNKVQHQQGTSECGVYSMNFLIRMARGDDFDKLSNNPISDKRINKCRAVYFDHHIHKNE
jgi:hypothetical protein